MSKIPTRTPDGRRNNRPSIEHQVKTGTVLNPHGRKGKRNAPVLSHIDRLYLAEAKRVVSHDALGEVHADLRLVQEEFHDALVNKSAAARSRIIRQIAESSSKADRMLSEDIDEILARKEELRDQFYFAQKSRTPAPDVVPHPEHVQIEDGRIIFTGPTDRAGRENWEHLKAIIKVAAYLHGRARDAYRTNGSEENKAGLKAAEAHRRWVMRNVPKGWNWHEEIYCRHSRTEFVKKTIAWLEAHS